MGYALERFGPAAGCVLVGTALALVVCAFAPGFPPLAPREVRRCTRGPQECASMRIMAGTIVAAALLLLAGGRAGHLAGQAPAITVREVAFHTVLTAPLGRWPRRARRGLP